MNLADGLSAQASAQPDGVAVVRGEQRLTFRQLEELVWRCAALLRRNGIGPGSVVGLTFKGEVPHLVASLALIRLGVVQVALPADASVSLRNASIGRAGVDVVLTDRDPPDGLAASAILVEIGRLAADRSAVDQSIRQGDLSSRVLLVIGSGTTGRPKMMAQTAGQLLNRFGGENAVPRSRGDCELDVGSLNFSTVKRRRIACLLAGRTNAFWGAKAEQTAPASPLRVDHLRLAPRSAYSLVDSLGEAGKRIALPRIRSVWLGGSTIGEPLRRLVRARISDNLVISYGMNECGTVAVATKEMMDRYPACVGKPGQGVAIEVVGPDGKSLPPGEVGDIRVRSPGMVSGYVDDPEADAKWFRDGWFYPNDLGAYTDDGVLIFHGRKDDLMIFDGINIFPREIEFVLESHPSVAEALAFPIRHPVHQDIPVAVVVLRVPVAEQDLIAFCHERIGSHAPHRIVVAPAIPEAARGKHMKRDMMKILGLTDDGNLA